MRELLRFFSSIKLALALGAAILLAAVAATFLAPDVAAARVYHARWFAALLALFALNLLACAWTRLRSLSWDTLGSFVCHLGALLVLAGAAAGALWGTDGYTDSPLREGQAIDHVTDPETKRSRPLPFQVVLEQFSLDLHPPRLWIYQEARPENQKMEAFVVRPGLTLATLGDEFRITVLQAYQNYKVRTEVREAAGEPRHPAVQLGIFDPKGKPAFEGWLGGAGDGRTTALVAAAVPDPQDPERPQPGQVVYLGCHGAPPPALTDAGAEKGTLFVHVRDEKMTRSFPVAVGAGHTLCENYFLRIEQSTLNYNRRTEPNEVLTPANPALSLLISGPKGEERRWVFSRYAEYAGQHEVTYPNLVMDYVYPEDAPVVARIYSLRTADGYRHQVYLPATRTTEELTLDRPCKLSAQGHTLKLTRFSPDATITLREEEAGGDARAPAVKVRVAHQGRERTLTLVPGGSTLLKGEDVLLAYGYQEGYEGDVRNFESRVQVLEGGRVAARATVSVNHPLVYQGYYIYQNAGKPNPQSPWSPSFHVVRDRGTSLVFAGLGLLSLGLCYAAFAPLRGRGGRA